MTVERTERTTMAMAFIGAILILLGAMPLNGWIGFQIDPPKFSLDDSLGSLQHFLLGAIPYAIGIILLARAKLSFRTFLKRVAQASIFPIALSPLFFLESVRFTAALAGWLILILIGLLISGGSGAIGREQRKKAHNKTRLDNPLHVPSRNDPRNSNP